MDNKYKLIDESNWKRSLHCQIFRNSIEPSYCVTFELDITNFLAKIRAMKKISEFEINESLATTIGHKKRHTYSHAYRRRVCDTA